MDLGALREFCSDDDRPLINTPWVAGNYIYATDGKALARLPALEHPALLSVIEKREYPKAEELFKKTPMPVEFLPCPELPKMPKEKITPCDRCSGEGEVECPHCKQYMDCPDCKGDCETGRQPVRRVTVAGIDFDARLLYRFKKHFPDFEIGPNGERVAARIRFKGGEGLLMPMVR